MFGRSSKTGWSVTKEETVDTWLLGYERRDKKCIYIGGAVAALLVVGGLADKLFGAVNPVFRALFIISRCSRVHL